MKSIFNIKEKFIILAFVLFGLELLSQESLGPAISNYTPSNSILLNPSSSSDSKVFIDLNLVGLSSFLHNDHVYLNGGLLYLNRQSQSGITITENYNNTNAPYGAVVDVQVQGPSLSVSYGRFGGGFYTGFRNAVSVNGIPNHLMNHLRNGFNYAPQIGNEFTSNNVRLGALSWLEYGANFSYIFKQEGNEMLTAGGTIKILNGLSGAGVNIQEWNYEVANDSVLNSLEFRGQYGIHNFDPDNQSFLGNGSGVGIDLGFNYKSMKKSAQGYMPHTPEGCRLKEYDYKFGFSLLDIGRIKFDDGFSRQFDVQDSIIWNNYQGADASSDLSSIDDLISQNLLADSLTDASREVKMLLPTGFSAQFDYNLGYGFYANAVWVQGFNRKKRLGVERSSTLAITPRFESKPIDVALPIVIHDYQKFRLGFAVRVYYLTIGSDNIFSLIGGENKQTYGSDIYFNLKYTMFRPWYCSESKTKSRPKGRRKGRSSTPCPSW